MVLLSEVIHLSCLGPNFPLLDTPRLRLGRWLSNKLFLRMATENPAAAVGMPFMFCTDWKAWVHKLHFAR